MNLLFVGIDLNRTDLLRTIEPVTKQAQCFFLENFFRQEVSKSLAHELGTVIYWFDYADAFELLSSVRPDRIVYLLLDNYYHFAVFFAAKSLRIPVYYLDHGIRFEHEMDIMASLERGQLGLGQRLLRKNGLTSKLAFARNRFFRQTLRQLPPALHRKAISVFLSRSKNYFGDFMRKSGADILPDKIIAYAPETFAFYKRFFNIPAGWDSFVFTGIPSLDEFAWLRQSHPDEVSNGLLFIDQPMHEQRLAGWIKEKKLAFWAELVSLTKQKGLHLYIKPHPWTREHYHEVPALQNVRDVSIVERLDTDLCSKLRFVGSFNSTLLLAFCASPAIACFCMEAHPEKLMPEFSSGITKYGVAEPVHSFAELAHFIDDYDASLGRKAAALPAYMDAMLYAFDGKAKDRVNKALLE